MLIGSRHILEFYQELAQMIWKLEKNDILTPLSGKIWSWWLLMEHGWKILIFELYHTSRTKASVFILSTDSVELTNLVSIDRERILTILLMIQLERIVIYFALNAYRCSGQSRMRRIRLKFHSNLTFLYCVRSIYLTYQCSDQCDQSIRQKVTVSSQSYSSSTYVYIKSSCIWQGYCQDHVSYLGGPWDLWSKRVGGHDTTFPFWY